MRLKILYIIVLLPALCCCLNNDYYNDNLEFILLPRTLQNDFHSSLTRGVLSEAKTKHVHVSVYAPVKEDDYKFQIAQLETIISKRNVDGVIITPNHSIEINRYLERLDDMGIPYLVVDTPLHNSSSMKSDKYCGYVGTDNRLGGKLAAEFVAREVTEGNILLVRGIESHQTSNDREVGFIARIKAFPGLKIVGIINGNWNRESAYRAIRDYHQHGKSNIDAVFAYNDLMALGVSMYYEGKKKRPVIVGYDGLIEAQEAILNKQMDATVVQEPDQMGILAINKLIECIRSNEYSRKVFLTKVNIVKATTTLTPISSYE